MTGKESCTQLGRAIEVDDRERHSGLIEALTAATNLPVSVLRLEHGDVRIGTVILEIKRRFDFFYSLEDGRLFSQLYRARHCCQRVILILEDPFWFRKEKRAELDGTIVRLAVGWCVPVLFTRNREHTASLIGCIGKQELLPARTWFLPRKRRDKIARDERIRVLAALPGVGIRKGIALLQYFGSLEKAFAAPEVELAKVDGIGPILARKIRALTAFEHFRQ